MNKVAIYVRLSREDIDKNKGDDSQSIANQKSMLSAYCKERNWDIYDIYCDDGYSGIDKTRPDFNRMISDCEQGKVDTVLCKDLSRFSRDNTVVDQLIYDKFIEWGIRFKGVADNSDNDSNHDTGMRLFVGAFNEYYVQDISRKVRKTMEHKRKQGQFVGSFAPYGYMKNPDDTSKLIIDDEAAEIVAEIFEMFANGQGYRKIIQSLNSRSIPSPSAYKALKGSNYICCNLEKSNQKGLWTQSTVEKMLRDETYIGTLVQGKTHPISHKNKKRKKVPKEEWIRCPDSHEPIVSNEIWSKVQDRINNRVRSDRITLELSPLSGKVKCAVCGRPMKRNIYWNKKHTIKYYNLQCASCKTGAMNCTNEHCMSGLQLEKVILSELNDMISAYCNDDDITIEDMTTSKVEALHKKLDSLNEQKSKARIRLDGIYTDKLDGVITTEDYLRYKEKFDAEIAELETKSNELLSIIEKYENNEHDNESRMNLITKYTHISELTKNIADEFIDTVFIGERNENGERDVLINWNV